mgnify:CR=1 FL=1
MRRRIQLFCVSMRSGGTERVVARFANYLGGINDVAITLLARSPMFYRVQSNIVVHQPDFGNRQELGWRWYPRLVGHIHRCISSFKPDVILCFGEDIAPIVLTVARVTGRTCIVFNRASPLHSISGLRKIVYPAFNLLARSVVIQTKQGQAMLRSRFPLSNCSVLPNPIEIPRKSRLPSERKRQIVNVGTLGGRKGQADLIKSFAETRLNEKWKVVFVGDGPDRQKLEELAHARGVSEAVEFVGQSENVEEILGVSRIFAFCSQREGFPNALGEALAAGCACVSYDCLTGPADLIENEVNGLLVPNGDRPAFRAALYRLAVDDSLQERVALSARRRIREFSSERVFAQLDSLIEEALAA